MRLVFLFCAHITARLFCMPHVASLPHLGTREVVVLVAGIPACSVLNIPPSRLRRHFAQATCPSPVYRHAYEGNKP